MSELFSRVKGISTPDVVRAFFPSMELKRDGSGREKALCPFHNEATPSFTVFEDGWKCFGCGKHGSNIDLLLAASLASSPLEAARMIAEKLCIEVEEKKPRKVKPVILPDYGAYVNLPEEFSAKTFHLEETLRGIAIPYSDENGKLVGVQIRHQLAKGKGKDARFSWQKGGKPYLYGAWAIPRWKEKETKQVLLCEGASDVQVCWFGQIPALGVPGASAFKAEWTSLLLPFSELCIIQEPGEAGEKFVKSITAALKEASYQGQVKAVTLPEKDPRDLWLKYGERFKQELEAAIVRAPVIDLKGKAIETKKQRTPITVRISDVQREEVSWLWNHRIPRGKLTIFEGDPGEGKSFLSQAIATTITRGFGLPGEEEQREPETVLIMNAEDGLADTIRPRLEDMGADISRVVALRGLTDEEGQERSLTLADLDVIEKAMVEHRPALVIVDPIIAYVAGKDTHKANEVRGLLAPLAALAEKYKCAILAIRHLNKSATKAAYRGQGSVDFLAACRSAFLAGQDPENPGQKVLCHIKANLGPITPSLIYTITDGRFLWGEESTLTAEQILAVPVEAEAKSKLDEAKGFLQDLLSSGPVASSEVEKEAKGAGIAPTTLKRAKTALGVKPRKASFGGGWIWDLPDRRRPSNHEDAQTKGMSIFGENEHLRAKEAGWEEV